IAVWDKADWTGSFLGASELMRSEIKNVKSLTSKDIYVTEYNFNYDPFTKYIYSSYIDWKSCLSDPIDWQNCHFGWAPQQYDWRSYLFTALELNTMIQEGVKEAAVWSDVASGYWSYSNDGGTQNYPLYYVLNSYANKTGNQLVPYSTTNLRTYSSNSVISDSAGKATNVPYLSIVPTKDVSKNKIYLTVVNRNQNSFETVDLNFNGVNITGNVTITTLQGTTLDSHPYKDNILITPKVSTIAVTNNAITTYQIPRYSIVFFEASTGSTIPTLTANCSASPTLANINQNVIFSSVVSGGNTPYTYSWLLTGACTGSSAICSVSFATAGVKTANLTVKSNDGQSRSASCPVSVGTY
ncbi:MAG: hypothetical protein NT094_02010, partial [Candidatus Staskawiczbacteria bacterium]|nr:hypothetical protein [Candidatus Staskawiczbacteria bacterium]